jgi:Pentapeptide repeats (8 copies)
MQQQGGNGQRLRTVIVALRQQLRTVIVAGLVTLVSLAILSYLVYLGYRIGWTGLGEAPTEKNVRSAKTLWDWLALFIVPALLAIGGVLISQQIQRQQKQREEIAANLHAQDEALRAYLDQMSDLMVDKKLREKWLHAKTAEHHLREGGPEHPDEHRLAQARTLATLLRLDKDRKKIPLKLIYELGLIEKGDSILDLKNAGLDTADLSEITLHKACLREADLRRADLRGADLEESDLTKADLRGANLSDADLSNTVLKEANLLPYDKNAPAKLNAPKLSNGTDPRHVNLSDDFVPTNLKDANLSGADLSGAYLTGAVDLTQEQLEETNGDKNTRLPPDLKPPAHWNVKSDEQIEGN